MTARLAAAGCLLWILAGGLDLGLPRPLAAQSVDALVSRGEQAGADPLLLGALRDRSERAGYDPAEVAGVLAPGVRLAERGLPSRMVLQKGLEGLAKRVPPTRLAAVLSRMEGSVERAAALAGPWLARPPVRRVFETPAGPAARTARVERSIVEGIAQALVHEVPETTVRELIDRVPAGLERSHVPPLDFAAALHALVDLPLARAEPALAADLLLRALNGGFGAAQLHQLPAAMRAAELRGTLPPEAVARRVIDQIARGTPAGAVLSGLFQGGIPGGPRGRPPPFVTPPRGRPDGS